MIDNDAYFQLVSPFGTYFAIHLSATRFAKMLTGFITTLTLIICLYTVVGRCHLEDLLDLLSVPNSCIELATGCIDLAREVLVGC